MVWLLEIVEPAAEDEILAYYISAVTTGENHFEAGRIGPELFGQFATVEILGHHQVGQDEVYFFLAAAPQVERLHTGLGLKNPVAVGGQQTTDEFTYRRFV